MPFMPQAEMIAGEPLPGWHGTFFHAERMTIACYEIADGAPPLHEHRHPEEEVWTVVAGRIAITIDGVEQIVEAGGAAIVPPNTPHAARPVGACRAVISDSPRRSHLPGMSERP